MWFPLVLTVGFALVFLALYLAERRHIEREADDARREGFGRPWGSAGVALGEADVPQPAPLRSRRVPIGEGGGDGVHARVRVEDARSEGGGENVES